MSNALAGFFRGMDAGSKMLSNAESNANRQAKERLALQGLQNAYADEQVLRADELRNAKAQYDFNTAKQSSDLDTLYRTHDGYVDATVAQNLFAKTNFDHKKKGIDTFGDMKNQSLLAQYELNNTRDTYQTEGLNTVEPTRIKNNLQAAQNNAALLGYKGTIFEDTKPYLYQKDMKDAQRGAVTAGNELYDANTVTEILPQKRQSAINVANTDVVNSDVNYQSAQGTAPNRIETNITDSVFANLTSEQKLGALQVTQILSAVPAGQEMEALADLAQNAETPAQRQAAAMLYKQNQANIDSENKALVDKLTLQVAPAQALENKGFNVEPLGDGTYVIEGKIYDEAGVAWLARKVLTDEEGENPYGKIEKQGEITRQNNALKSYQSLYNKLAEDGEISEEDKTLLDEAKQRYMSDTGLPVAPAPTVASPTEILTLPDNQKLLEGSRLGLYVYDANNNLMKSDNNGGYVPISKEEALSKVNNYAGKKQPETVKESHKSSADGDSAITANPYYKGVPALGGR